MVKKKGAKARRTQLLPGEYRRQSTVTAPVSSEEGGALMGHVKYIVETRRLDAAFSCSIQWVDLSNQGHRVRLPHAVMEAVYRHRDSIIKESLRRRGQQAAGVRQARSESFLGRVNEKEG